MGRVEELFQVIKEAHEEISKIQGECKHEDWDIGYYSWRPGNIEIRRICKFCRAPLGVPPTPEEIGNFDDPMKVRLGFGSHDQSD